MNDAQILRATSGRWRLVAKALANQSIDRPTDQLIVAARLLGAGDGVKSQMTTKRCRILLADDDPLVQRAVQRVSAQFGHEILSVTAGTAVFEAAVRLAPDLIVLDVNFPDADGRDVLRELKASSQTKDIPVLVWSARRDRDSESRIALSLGAEDYVEKSNAELLMRKIERVLLRFTDSAA